MPAPPLPPVGTRIVVRSLVPGETGPSGGPAMTDVLGVLEAADATTLTVRRRDESLVTVERSQIVALKAIPPPAQGRN